MKSIRIIVDTLVEAVQQGLAQRDTRRASRGSADLKAASVAVAAAAVAAVAAGAPAAEVGDRWNLCPDFFFAYTLVSSCTVLLCSIALFHC